MPNDEFDEYLRVLSLRTSLEEVLDWDVELADYLVGAWSHFSPDMYQNKEVMISLYAAQLPPDKYEKFSKKLEKWLSDNYNIFTR